MTMTGIRPIASKRVVEPAEPGQTSGRHRRQPMEQTDSGAKSPNETVEPSGKTIHNARWRFEWRNLKNNRRFPL